MFPLFPGRGRRTLLGVAASFVMAGAVLAPAPTHAAATAPTFEALNQGPLRLRPMPGTQGFSFSLYGAPGDLNSVRELTGVLQREHLANAWDPGPGPGPGSEAVMEFLARLRWPVVFYSGGEMQIMGGRAVFGEEQRKRVRPLDDAGVFNAYQLGEWGYYFHNLAATESWWRSVYGAEFETYRHLMKPKGLAGYYRFPKDRRECYDTLRNYFLSRSHDLLGRVISVTGHSHYEAYAGEWGARCIGLEVGENIAFTQSKLAFARGASRRWDKPWSVQVSPWFHGSCTTSGPLRAEGGVTRGLDAGHSLSFYERMWLHGWFAGASMVTPENNIAIFFEKAEAPWTLTSHGRKAAEVFQFVQSHDRGIPFMPVAVVLDHLAGYNGYMDKPWGILPPTPGDREVRDLFDAQLFPGADHIHARPDPANPEQSYLRPTPVGECVDVLLSDAPADLLRRYPIVLLAGDIEFTPETIQTLDAVLRSGSRVMISARHRDALGSRFATLSRRGSLEVLPAWTNPDTGRPAAVPNERLREVVRSVMPVEVEAEGQGVQYQVNRTSTGWVVELIRNRGVAKKPGEPAVVDPAVTTRVRLHARKKFGVIREWRSGTEQRNARDHELTLGPGAVEYVEFRETNR